MTLGFKRRLRFYREAFGLPLKLVLGLEFLVGGWDTATSHIRQLEDYAIPVVQGLTIGTWGTVLVLTLVFGIAEHSYRIVQNVRGDPDSIIEKMRAILVTPPQGRKVRLDRYFLSCAERFLHGDDLLAKDIATPLPRSTWPI